MVGKAPYRHNYQIRSSCQADVEQLMAFFPEHDEIFGHEWLISRQMAGHLDYVAAWSQEIPLGRGVILWEGYSLPELAAEFPETPVIRAVEVLEQHRHLGIGGAITECLERRARARGYINVSLGVMPGNHLAEKLWRRLGYEDWGKGVFSTISIYEDRKGNEVKRYEQFLPMRKHLYGE